MKDHLKILFILLAGITLSASPYLPANPVAAAFGADVRKKAGGSAIFILDSVTGAAGGWSVSRKLDADYGGNAILVRRSSDDTTQAIGFTGDPAILDEASLETFCSGTNGYVVTIYDQSGGTFADITDPSGGDTGDTTDQPQIVVAGVMHKDGNGNAYCEFDNSDDELTFTDTFSASVTLWVVCDFGAFGNNDRSWGVDSTEFSFRLRTSLNELAYDVDGTELDTGGNVTASTKHLVRHGIDATNLTLRLDNGDLDASTARGGASTTSRSFFLGSAGGINFSPLIFYEAYIWEADQTGDSSTIESDVDTHFAIPGI